MLEPMQDGWIPCQPGVLGGKPVIRGTRISVAFILQSLASGMSVEDILRAYPHPAREGIPAAVEFAARVMDGESVQSLQIR
jgi:uncharacterized protein (DUF433 family)